MEENRSSRSTPEDPGEGHPLIRRIVLASQHRQIETAVEWLEDLALEQEVDDELLNRLLVAVSEAVTNSLCHGNQLNPVRDVVMEVKFGPEDIEVTVEDEGVGFEPKCVEDPLEEENLWKEGGRGVYLMEELTDEVRFGNDGRRVHMYFLR